MALPKAKTDREYEKFTVDFQGNTAVRVEASMIQGDATSIQGVPVNNTPPQDKSRLVYDEQSGQWVPVVDAQTGWLSINDDTYTEVSPFNVASETRTKLLINKDSTITAYSPTGDSSWWNDSTNRFQPDTLGGYWEIRLSMKINPSVANRNLNLELDIGGTQGVVFTDDFRMTSGSGDFRKSFVIPIFTLQTFINNGGEFYVTSNTSLEIYDLSLVIFKQWAP